MMVHRFSDQRDPRHIPERGHKIFALKFAMQLAVDQAPTLGLLQPLLHFSVTQFLRRHTRLHIGHSCSFAIMRRKYKAHKERLFEYS